MALCKKLTLTFVKVFILALLYIIAVCGLFFAYKFYQKENFAFQEILGIKKFLTQKTEKMATNENNSELLKNVLHKVPTTQSASSLEYVNIKSYPYIINEPNKCKDENPFLLFLIETTANEVYNRKAIRTTFGNKDSNKRASIMCMFLLGTDEKQDRNAILEESQTYHDIIQKDFHDTYKNLTFKTLMGIEWVSDYCPTAKYVMKTDSDMFVNTDYLLDLLGPDQPQKQNYFTGFVMEKNRPHRNLDSKWHMPYSLYPAAFYPDFCSGTGYVFSGDVAPKILRSSSKVKYVYLEDVFVGICLDREGIKVTYPPKNGLFNNDRVPFSPCGYNRIITSHYINPTELLNFWIAVQENKDKCSRAR